MITTIKRVQTNREWYYHVEDCNTEVDEAPQSGLSIKYFDEFGDVNVKGATLLSVCKEDALAIRDAINQLYPPE